MWVMGTINHVTLEDLPSIPKADKARILVLGLEGFLFFSYPLMCIPHKSQLCRQSGLVCIFRGSS